MGNTSKTVFVVKITQCRGIWNLFDMSLVTQNICQGFEVFSENIIQLLKMCTIVFPLVCWACCSL